jgi:hypothetical protein
VAFSLSWLHLFEVKQRATAGPPPALYQGAPDGSDGFLTAPVYNYPSHFAGPAIKTQADVEQWEFLGQLPQTPNFPPKYIFPPGYSAYGIWNGASMMEISYTQRFDQWDLMARIPVWDTEYARTYAMAGGRFAWIFDRFWWRTQSVGLNPNSLPFQPLGPNFPASDRAELRYLTVSEPTDVARYSNTLSQRMYGPVLGCGYETYLGKGFAISTDLYGGLLINIIKERAKYKLGDESVQNKFSRNDLDLVPNIEGNINLSWYPIRGIQMRVGYNFMGFFNAKYMQQPVGFNYGAIDYVTEEKFRFFHGINAGVGFVF